VRHPRRRRTRRSTPPVPRQLTRRAPSRGRRHSTTPTPEQTTDDRPTATATGTAYKLALVRTAAFGLGSRDLPACSRHGFRPARTCQNYARLGPLACTLRMKTPQWHPETVDRGFPSGPQSLEPVEHPGTHGGGGTRRGCARSPRQDSPGPAARSGPWSRARAVAAHRNSGRSTSWRPAAYASAAASPA
jgi:hypothetical protein